ncbi:MAG TPA: GxxExxY protein [Anaerolineales bacterium]|nr:GxxExxY protein [Anaerolineales bacterium]HRQ93211.1 GxxExxY protein [Anaerolineales bacterium]
MHIDELTKIIIGCAYNVSNTLGAGFLEKVYENALVIELRNQGVQAEQQLPFKITYKGFVVGEYVADLVVGNLVLVEIKVARALDKAHMAQCINYLTAAQLNLALLMNFAKSKVEIQRVVRGL